MDKSLRRRRERRAPIRRAMMAARAAEARQYLRSHRVSRWRRPKRLRLVLQLALRGAGIGLLFGVALILAEVGLDAAGAAVAAVQDSIARLIPAAVLERDPRATAEPPAPNAAPVLDSFGSVTNNPRLVVSGRLPSFVLGAGERPRIEVLVNSALAASPALDAAGRFSATVALAPGQNVIVVAAVRGIERTPSSPRTIVLDTAPPPLSVTKPTDGATVEGPSVVVEGRSESGAHVTVNGHATTVAGDGAFSDTLPAPPGPLAIEVVARDAAGNGTKKTVKVTVQQPGQSIGLAVSVSLDRTSVKAGASVTADVVVTDQSSGLRASNVAVAVTAGLSTVGSGQTDSSGRYRVTFAAPAVEGIVQILALATGTNSSGRGATQLEVTK